MPANYLESILSKRLHPKHPLLIAALMLFFAIVFGLLTLIFIYVSNDAKSQVDALRQDYSQRADRRDTKVDEIARQQAKQGNQLNELQDKVDSLPSQTADKVTQVVKEEGKQQ